MSRFLGQLYATTLVTGSMIYHLKGNCTSLMGEIRYQVSIKFYLSIATFCPRELNFAWSPDLHADNETHWIIKRFIAPFCTYLLDMKLYPPAYIIVQPGHGLVFKLYPSYLHAECESIVFTCNGGKLYIHATALAESILGYPLFLKSI